MNGPQPDDDLPTGPTPADEAAVFGVTHSQDLSPAQFEAELAAASVLLASVADRIQPIPPSLRQRLVDAANSAPAGRPPVAPAPQSAADQALGETSQDRKGLRRLRPMDVLLALAAGVLLAVGMFGSIGTPRDGYREARARLIDSAPDMVRVSWSDPADPQAKPDQPAKDLGDVVWSDSLQRGFMRFRGLAANNPEVEQYQLWVFDSARDERYPVDGGVFDLPQGTEETLVPIRVKLPVSRATLFAVTIERPGGVVVSDRSRLPVLAKAPELP